MAIIHVQSTASEHGPGFHFHSFGQRVKRWSFSLSVSFSCTLGTAHGVLVTIAEMRTGPALMGKWHKKVSPLLIDTATALTEETEIYLFLPISSIKKYTFLTDRTN